MTRFVRTTRRNSARWLFAMFVCTAILGAVTLTKADEPSTQQTPADADIEFFETRIRPVLVEHCYQCHSEKAVEKNRLKGGLLLDSREGILTGGDSGPALKPGHETDSLLMESLRYESYEMPPEGKLPDEVVADFATWIKRGAADPRSKRAAIPPRVIDREAGRQHWAYLPFPVPPRLPDSTDDSVAPIDRFIDARLRAAGITAAPEADRMTLARRLSFDLVGLPPSPELIDAFVNDRQPDAYERLVDQLLASPHFGERWARHWLDVVRFAESVTLRGLVQHEAWRYRDYVMDAFNDDLPYDDFLREQIAGDLLTADSLEERRRQHIATTFLTLTDANLEDQDKEKLRMDVVDEQLNVIGKALLGQTIGCARCHDHKFDPIPTTDYYAMAGILRNTRTMNHANVSRWIERPLPLPPEQAEEVAAYDRQVDELKQQIALIKSQLDPQAKRLVRSETLPGIVVDDEQATFVGEWMRSTSVRPFIDSGYRHDMNAGRGEKSATFRVTLPKSGAYEVRLGYTSDKNRSSAVRVVLRTKEGERTVTIDQRIKPPVDDLFVSLGEHHFDADRPVEVVITNAGANGHVIVDAVQFLLEEADKIATATKEDTPVTNRQPAESEPSSEAIQEQLKNREADLIQLQKSAPPQPRYQGVTEESEITNTHVNVRGNVHNLGELVPRGFLQVVPTTLSGPMPKDESGRRQLGDWLADPKNPLPSRVYVNRVWHWLFGAGIVTTPDNLGTTGQLPSHPKLLDYLAGRFIEQGWSTKKIVREIVLSQAYRRSSQSTDSPPEVDTENRLLWRMNRRRLEAECLQDAILTVSGQRDDRIGGKTLPDGLEADYDFTHDSSRRALYWPQLRNAIPDLIKTFDGANPSLVSGRRNVSSVAPQSLYLLNNPWIAEQSRLAAQRLMDDQLSDSARIQMAFRRTLGRLPTDDEARTVTEFLTHHPTTSDEDRLVRWTQLVQSLFGTLDFRYVH